MLQLEKKTRIKIHLQRKKGERDRTLMTSGQLQNQQPSSDHLTQRRKVMLFQKKPLSGQIITELTADF